jgi:hypothetical protein
MRLFGIDAESQFTEYLRTPFQANYEEKTLESWLEGNPDGIVEDGSLLVIGRQVATNLASVIDLLAIDREGDLVVIELKRDRTPRDTLAQALEYASYVERLDWRQLEEILQSYLVEESASLVEYHRDHFELDEDEAVSFNKEQRIVILGQSITEAVRQTAGFLRRKGIRVTCVEFSLFQTDAGVRLLSQDIVVGREPAGRTRISTASRRTINQDEFLASLDENGQPVFQRILAHAESRGYPIHWGSRGFSANVDMEGVHVPLCDGYPTSSRYGQCLRTCMARAGSITSKIDLPEGQAESMLADADATGLFQPARGERRCPIDRAFSDDEIETLVEWMEGVAEIIRTYGLRPQ